MTYIDTTNSDEFCYFPVATRSLNLAVSAAHDARIALRTHLGEDSNFYEIVIGAMDNTISYIRKSNRDSHVAQAYTNDIISTDADCSIEIQWYCDGLLRVSVDYSVLVLTFKDNEPFVLNFVGLATSNGATGKWMIDGIGSSWPAVRGQLADSCSDWIDCTSDQELPRNAVAASEDGLYVGRARHNDTVTPGGIRSGILTLPWGGQGHHKSDFQVLCRNDVSWARGWGGSVPLHALAAGESEDGCPLFVGRILHEGIYYVGKIQPTHNTCYISVRGQEKAFKQYEVLILGENLVECIGR